MKHTAILLLALALHGVAAAQSSDTFAAMKSLAGNWQGTASEGPEAAHGVKVTFRLISGGSAMVGEIDHEQMMTVFHPDGASVVMTHYCGAGNQPRMRATSSPDGKTIDFAFLDATNLQPGQPGHMQRLVLKLLDAGHHIEEWHFLEPDGKETVGVFDLHRVLSETANKK